MRLLAAALSAVLVWPGLGATGSAEWQPLAALRNAYARYEDLERQGPFAPLPLPSRAVRIGEPYRDAARLRLRLTALGDLGPRAQGLEEPGYTAHLAEAVRRFQARHGLEPDGVLGRRTIAELNVPISRRKRQLAHAMEVIERQSQDEGRRSIVVSVPLFRLWAWSGAPWRSTLQLEARTIVGSPQTPTPDLDAIIRSITFRPFWTVPVSIASAELVPAIRREPAYLDRHHFDIVDRSGTQVAYSTAVLPELASGGLHLRQRPGPSNALGLVRFDFPNPHGVSLHDTSARHLFARAGRALSHGCIRVDDPARLAEWVLDDVAWDAEAVAAAFAGPDNRHVPLSNPVRIHVVYLSALVTPDGTLHFGSDLYHRFEFN